MAKRGVGTIPLGETEGVHLLAIYQPQQGVVLAQMNVEHKGREITFAPTLLHQMDLRGVVVSGDAMFDRRSLSLKVVQAHGDYLWTVKDNEATLSQDIEVLFQPYRKRPGTSAPPMDFRSASTIEKGHGRLDKRAITVSSLLANYSDWPELAQVFKLERHSTNTLGKTKTQVRYGITSLPAHLGVRTFLAPLFPAKPEEIQAEDGKEVFSPGKRLRNIRQLTLPLRFSGQTSSFCFLR